MMELELLDIKTCLQEVRARRLLEVEPLQLPWTPVTEGLPDPNAVITAPPVGL